MSEMAEMTFPQKLAKAKELGYGGWRRGADPMGDTALAHATTEPLKTLYGLIKDMTREQRVKMSTHYYEGWCQRNAQEGAMPDKETFPATIKVTIEKSELGLTVWDAQGRFIVVSPESVTPEKEN